MKIDMFRSLICVGLLGVSTLAGAQTVTIAVPSNKSTVKISADKTLLSTNTSAPYTRDFSNSASTTQSFATVASGDSATQASTTMNAAAVAPVSATRSYVYDQFDRLCKSINPESGATVIDYDGASNIVWTAEGTTLTGPNCDRASVPEAAKSYRTYDKMNRLLTITTPTGQANLTLTYTQDGLVASSATNSSDNILVTNTYAYGKRRLLESETVAQPGWYTWSVSYGYDANGHQSKLTYPNGLVVDYAPNALGQATQVSNFASGISYYPNGAIKTFTYANGIVHTMTPNLRGLPEHSLDKYGSTATLDDTYSFDANDNVSTIIDQAQGTARGMQYDGLDRLTTAVSTPTAAMWGEAHYTYDALDNLRSSSLGLSGYTYDYDANNRLATLGRTGGGAYTYVTDPRGNITNDGLRTYTWDFLNRMYAVNGKEYYRYDGQGRRVMSWRPTGPGQISLFMYSQSGQVLYVEDGLHAQSTDNIYLGNSLLATRSQSYSSGAVSFRYQHTDALGSPVAVTDSSRAVVERTIYAPYGAPVNRPVEGIGYTGHVMDQTTGLIYMQQRYYDPQIGRFLSVDPVAANAGAGFNRFDYANDNPYRFTDPDGRSATMCAHDPCAPKPPIQGTAQTSSNTPTHASTSQRIANAEAAKPGTKSVHLNQSLRTVTGDKNAPNIRPDVTVVKNSGTIDMHEVRSTGQSTGELVDKLSDARSGLGIPGKNIVVEPDTVPRTPVFEPEGIPGPGTLGAGAGILGPLGVLEGIFHMYVEQKEYEKATQDAIDRCLPPCT